MRVAIICVVPQIARVYAPPLRDLGHEPVCVITPRRMRPEAPATPFAAEHVDRDDPEIDVLFAASRGSLVRLLSAYDLDLGPCTTFPWRLSAEAIAVPRLGIVNGHPSLLPRYRGPFPIACARGERGEPQEGGEYQSGFEDDYRYVDTTGSAAAVHRQARAWNFMPPTPGRGPILERDGTSVRLASTSLVEVEGAERLQCADGPLWILQTEPA